MISIPIHSVLMLVGPSYCGKSTFADSVKKQLKDKYEHIKVSIISSDEIRRELLDDDSLDKYDSAMQEVSGEAFELLFTKLKLKTSYPVNNHIVIVDTTGLSPDFRTQVKEMTKNNHYNLIPVLFNYKNKDEYLKGVPSEYNRRKTVFNHIERFRKEAKTSIRKKDYKQVITISKKEEVELEISNWNEYLKTQLDEEYKYDTVGDTHGCEVEFKALVKQLGYTIENDMISGNSLQSYETKVYKDSKIIVIGDLVNKGDNSKALLSFILKNKDKIIIVEGNHERFNYEYFKKNRENLPEDVRLKLFQDTEVYKDDVEYQDMLNQVIELGVPFVETKRFIACHAPCNNKYLGKIDSYSKMRQQKTQTPKKYDYEKKEDYLKAKSDYYEFIRSESRKNHKYHIYGHTTISKPLRHKNKILIDTGCVFGNFLTSVTITDRGKILFTTEKSQKEKSRDIDELFVSKDEEYSTENYYLTNREYDRVDKLVTNKVNFISGTVSPSPSNIKNNELESLEDCFQYFKNNNVDELVLQPKYMGSRCNIYLFEDVSKCYAISRNGYRININLDDTYKKYIEKFKDRWKDTCLIILDGELLPWQAIGKGLIEEHFETISLGLEKEHSLLEDLNFFKELEKLEKSKEESDFDKERVKVSKKDLSKKYGNNVYESYVNFDYFKNYDFKTEKENAKIYKEQLENFTQEQDLEYKVFMILKEVKKDGKEILMTELDNYETFNFINDDGCLLINLNDEDALDKAKSYYKELTEKLKLEGVMVKPRVYKDKVAPMMKVRNKSYLTLIYGHNYLQEDTYKTFVKEKRVKSKIRSSIKEFKLGLNMLKIPYSELNKENNRYEALIINFIAEENKTKELDPKL